MFPMVQIRFWWRILADFLILKKSPYFGHKIDNISPVWIQAERSSILDVRMVLGCLLRNLYFYFNLTETSRLV